MIPRWLLQQRGITPVSCQGSVIIYIIPFKKYYAGASSPRLQYESQNFGIIYVSEKLPTYPSPKPTFYPKWEVSINVALGEELVGSFPER